MENDPLGPPLIILGSLAAAVLSFVFVPLGQLGQKWRDRLRRCVLPSYLVLLGIIIILILVRAFLSYQRGWRGQATVPPTRQSYIVWSAPSDDAVRVGEIAPDEKVTVGPQSGEWTRVSTERGEEGWVDFSFSAVDRVSCWLATLLPIVPSVLVFFLMLIHFTRRGPSKRRSR